MINIILPCYILGVIMAIISFFIYIICVSMYAPNPCEMLSRKKSLSIWVAFSVIGAFILLYNCIKVINRQYY